MIHKVQPKDYERAVMDLCQHNLQLGFVSFPAEIISRAGQYRLDRLTKGKSTEQQEQIERWRKEAEANPVPPEDVKTFLDGFYGNIKEVK